MVVDGRMRRRSRRMRGKFGDHGADLMKPRGGIRCLLKSGCGSGKSGQRGIQSHVGAPVKPSVVESEVKPRSANSAEDKWIYVRECRIERSGLRFNSHGEVYVPDSEDDESGADLAPAVVANGSAGADLAPAVAADGAAGVDVAPVVAADGAVGMEMNPEVAARLAKKILGEDLHPEVAARLAEVLSRIEPFCHEWFIGTYKCPTCLSVIMQHSANPHNKVHQHVQGYVASILHPTP